MLIGGFQKMTVLDYPEKIACILFTHGCNFRCPFCHNAPLVTERAEELDENEIFAYLNRRAGILDGICVSGGEPFLQPDILEFLKRLKKTGLSVKIDTNGTFPEKLKEAAGLGLLDYVAMDIKNSAEKYPLTTGCAVTDKEAIDESISFIMKSGIDYEFRTTVVKELHTKEDMEQIGKRIAGAKQYFLQSFTDSGSLIGENLHAHTPETMRRFADIVRPYVQNVGIRGID